MGVKLSVFPLNIFCSLSAVPCVPLNVSVEMECGSGDAMVSWTATQGAVRYRAFALSNRGEAATCESSAPHCAMQNLTCGVPYRVQVVSVGDNCTSLPSQAAEFHTGEEHFSVYP